MNDDCRVIRYCQGLHQRLVAELANNEAVRSRVASLEALAPTFPELLFCKALVLPVVDQWTNDFLREQFCASQEEVFGAMRCEGYRTLPKYYQKCGTQTGFSSTPITKAAQEVSKTGKRPGGPACPDWCIRYSGPAGSLRLVCDAKYARDFQSKASMVSKLRRDLFYYLNVKSDPLTDWRHDAGYGVAYVSGGGGERSSDFVTDFWETQRILMSVFYACRK
jgi:hypothetical protein